MSTEADRIRDKARVRAKLEEIGADTLRAKLISIMAVTTLGQGDHLEPLGDNVWASRREMQEWLDEGDAREDHSPHTTAPCSLCLRETVHNILHERTDHKDDYRITTHAMLECRGCGTFAFLRIA